MTHLTSTTASDTNRALQLHIFGSVPDNCSVEFVRDWKMSDKNGAHYMKAHGYDVLSESLKLFLEGKYTTHRYLHPRISNHQDGVATLSSNDCSVLNSITNAKTTNTKHVMVLRAVRRKVLSPDVIQFSCGATKPTRPLGGGKRKGIAAAAKDKTVSVMLVDAEETTAETAPRGKKRRRKKEAEPAPADNST